MSKAQRQRKKMIREGRLNPVISRNMWARKPATQIVKNKKAEQRRSFCRKSRSNSADFFTKCFLSTHNPILQAPAHPETVSQ